MIRDGDVKNNLRLYHSSQYLVTWLLCSDSYKIVLISGLCPKETCLISERRKLHQGWGLLEIMNLLLPWLWDTIKGNAASASASKLSSGRGWEGGSCFWPGHPPAAAEQARLFLGRRRGGYDSSPVHGVTWNIPVHFILSLYFLNSFTEV